MPNTTVAGDFYEEGKEPPGYVDPRGDDAPAAVAAREAAAAEPGAEASAEPAEPAVVIPPSPAAEGAGNAQQEPPGA